MSDSKYGKFELFVEMFDGFTQIRLGYGDDAWNGTVTATVVHEPSDTSVGVTADYEPVFVRIGYKESDEMDGRIAAAVSKLKADAPLTDDEKGGVFDALSAETERVMLRYNVKHASDRSPAPVGFAARPAMDDVTVHAYNYCTRPEDEQ